MLFVNKQTFDAASNAGAQCIYARNVGMSLTKTWKQLTIINNGKLAFKYLFIPMTLWHNSTNTCSGGGGSGFKRATFIKYRLNQIIKSKSSDWSEMKIMIQWVTYVTDMGFWINRHNNSGLD